MEMDLLARFADPETLKTMSIAQRLTAGLITTILGMGITFTALVILQFIISMMAKFTAPKVVKSEVEITPAPEPVVATEQEKSDDNEQLIAAITVALATQLQTATSNIVIRNIRRVEESSPTWNRIGLAEQMNNHS